MKIFCAVLFCLLLVLSCLQMPRPASADDVTTLPAPARDGSMVCSSHILFLLPVLEQSVCGISSLELLWQSVCSAGGGTWQFKPGETAQCVGYKRPDKPKPKES